MKCDSRIHFQTNVDVMFLTETSLNEFLNSSGVSGKGPCLMHPVTIVFFNDVGLSFHCVLGLFCEQDNAFSVLSAFQSKVTNGVLSVL